MRILIIGASGTIGREIVTTFGSEHEIIQAGRNGKDIQVDISSIDSIQQMYKKVGKVDAVVNAAGGARFAKLTELTPEINEVGITSKQKGQVNLVLLGMDYVKDNGSFTLTTGVMMDDPIREGAGIAMANGAVKYFVKAAAIEMPRGIRINSVSPTIIEESWGALGSYFQGFDPAPASKAALLYKKSVLGLQTGKNFEMY